MVMDFVSVGSGASDMGGIVVSGAHCLKEIPDGPIEIIGVDW